MKTSKNSKTKQQKSISLPETPSTSVTPYLMHAHIRSSQFNWLRTDPRALPPPINPPKFMLHPCLHNLDLPFADDSSAVTPSSDLYDSY